MTVRLAWDLRYRVKGGRHIHAVSRWVVQEYEFTITGCGYPIHPDRGHHPLPPDAVVTCPSCLAEIAAGEGGAPQ